MNTESKIELIDVLLDRIVSNAVAFQQAVSDGKAYAIQRDENARLLDASRQHRDTLTAVLEQMTSENEALKRSVREWSDRCTRARTERDAAVETRLDAEPHLAALYRSADELETALTAAFGRKPLDSGQKRLIRNLRSKMRLALRKARIHCVDDIPF